MSKITATLSGTSASNGIVIGKAFVYKKDDIIVEIHTIDEQEVEKEYKRFEKARLAAKEELLALRSKFDKDVQTDIAEILKAHIQILEDPSVIRQVQDEVKKQRKNVEYVYNSIMLDYVNKLRSLDNEILAERAQDVLDIRNRVLRNLTKLEIKDASSIEEPVIIVAHNLTPSDTLHFERDLILGFAVDIGGKTSHTAILSRSLGIPAVVGLNNATSLVRNDDIIILDGIKGALIINPDDNLIKEYETTRDFYRNLQAEYIHLAEFPAATLDHETFVIEANMEFPYEAEDALHYGAEGVGLYRTEFLYINEDRIPTEEEQYENYKEVVQSFNGKPITIRTLDLGGDKFITKQVGGMVDENPFLGWRAIRFCLANPEIFKTQLRAILRAAVYGQVNIMFPMISNIEEYDSAVEYLEEAKQELRKAGIPYSDSIKTGIMIEIPSAALMSDRFAKRVDFFSIGTNDLIQYTLACDRTNEKISYLYDPLHPSVLSLIKLTVDNAHKEGIPVAMCGEMAGEPIYAAVLVGLGLDVLSMSSSLIPKMKRVIRGLNADECRTFTESLLTGSCTNQIRKTVAEHMHTKFPDIIEKRY